MADIYPPRDLPGKADNWGRVVEKNQTGLEGRITDVEQQLSNRTKSASGSSVVLARQILAMPITAVAGDQRTGFGLAAGWGSYATTTLTIPDGRTKAKIMATGGAAAVDMTTMGITTSYGRIVIGSSISVSFAAAKDAGSSAVNNILTMSHTAEVEAPSGTVITVMLQLNPLNAAAYPTNPGNYASINAIAVFTN